MNIDPISKAYVSMLCESNVDIEYDKMTNEEDVKAALELGADTFQSHLGGDRDAVKDILSAYDPHLSRIAKHKNKVVGAYFINRSNLPAVAATDQKMYMKDVHNKKGVHGIGFEDVKNIRKGKNSSRMMSSWTYTEIRTAIGRVCEEAGVQLSEQGSIYRSQRCSSCGFVHKKSRKAKLFDCIRCGHQLDADLNGALNHEADLDPIPYSILGLKLNMIGFYWLESGLFDENHQEIAVPDVQEN